MLAFNSYSLRGQKYIIISVIGGLNILLSTLFLYYADKWYAFLFILALSSFLNGVSCLLIWFKKMTITADDYDLPRLVAKAYLYVVPCYNESIDELRQALDSLVVQRVVPGDVRCLLIICDGKATGQGNKQSTDLELLELLHLGEHDNHSLHEYTTWHQKINVLKVYRGIYTTPNLENGMPLPFLLFLKGYNVGKRDSLVLARTLCYQRGHDDLTAPVSPESRGHDDLTAPVSPESRGHDVVELEIENDYDEITSDCPRASGLTGCPRAEYVLAGASFMGFGSLLDCFQLFIHEVMRLHSRLPETKLDYIIGIDADTIFDYECSYELIQGLEQNPMNHGCVGYVDIRRDMNPWHPFVLYQYGEYMFAQCLRRLAQSMMTGKVNCLSGCNQILRISLETCGPQILNKFNTLPSADDSATIFDYIRSYASEDRNHVCHVLSIYPSVRTTQAMKAKCYTVVPTSATVFFSQRRRWTLGATCNDLLLVYLPGIVVWERISSFVNVVTFSLTPFVFVATVTFFKVLIECPTWLLLYLSIIVIVPLAYGLLIPVFIQPLTFRGALYFYLAKTFHLVVGIFISLGIYFYAFGNMDVLTWGKTRQIVLQSPSGQIDYKFDNNEFKYDEEEWNNILLARERMEGQFYFEDSVI